jgi:hypothetical protein
VKYGVFRIDVVVLKGKLSTGEIDSQYPSVATKLLGILVV